MGSEKYTNYIINLLIRMGYCYEVQRVYGIETIKDEYITLFIATYNPLICLNSKGDSFLINIGLFKMYQHDKLTLRDMEKELFLINGKLDFLSKSSIQRLSVKIKEFNEKEYLEEKIKISLIYSGLYGEDRLAGKDRLEQEIEKTEQAINQSNFYSEIAKGNVSTKSKRYYTFKFEKDIFKKLLERERSLRVWNTFVSNKFISEEHQDFTIISIRRLIKKSFKLKYITKNQNEFNNEGGAWIHNKTLNLYVENFKDRYNLNELGIKNFNTKFIKEKRKIK